MNILFVAPYPPSRIRSRSYGFIHQLREEHSVMILSQVATQQEWEDVEMLRKQKYEVMAIAESRYRSLLRSGMALCSAYPIQAAYARSERFLNAAHRLCKRQHFDIVHVEHLRGMASMEPLVEEYPIMWDAVDCLSALWRQITIVGKGLAMRALSHLECERTEKYEASLLKKQLSVSAISTVDRDALLSVLFKYYPHEMKTNAARPVEVLPNGVDLDYFSPAQEKYRPYRIVFSGKMSYHANVAAVHYLYRQIMPRIWKEQANATLTIVGSKPPKSVQNLARDERVEVTGYVDDIRPYIWQAHMVISPMLYSVGLQNKILEAMALGTPAVISAQPAKALGVESGQEVLVASSDDEFAQKAIQLMNDTSLRANISARGRAHVVRHHDWRNITKRLIKVYAETM